MSLNGKYISIQEIIRECFVDNRYSYQLPTQDAIEWAVSAVELIGVPMAYSPKQTRVKIENYRGMLPCDLHDVEQVAGSFNGCSPFAMRSSTNTLHPVFSCDPFVINQDLLEGTTTLELETPIGQDSSGNPVYEINTEFITSLPSAITNTSNNSSLSDATYNLNDSFIFTNFKCGYVFIAYKAMPVDKDGFPLIPDNRRFKEAVKSFIRYKVDYVLWRTGELEKMIFDYSEREWLFYVQSAANAAHTPNRDQLQSLLQAIKLIPNKYAHSTFFNTLGSK